MQAHQTALPIKPLAAKLVFKMIKNIITCFCLALLVFGVIYTPWDKIINRDNHFSAKCYDLKIRKVEGLVYSSDCNSVSRSESIIISSINKDLKLEVYLSESSAGALEYQNNIKDLSNFEVIENGYILPQKSFYETSVDLESSFVEEVSDFSNFEFLVHDNSHIVNTASTHQKFFLRSFIVIDSPSPATTWNLNKNKIRDILSSLDIEGGIITEGGGHTH